MENTPEVKPDVAEQLRAVIGTKHSVAVSAPVSMIRTLLDRLAVAESLTTVLPCILTRTAPYDFDYCEAHDRTFEPGGTCEYAGKTVVDRQDEVIAEQRVRAMRAEDKVERVAELASTGAETDNYGLEYVRADKLRELLGVDS